MANQLSPWVPPFCMPSPGQAVQPFPRPMPFRSALTFSPPVPPMLVSAPVPAATPSQQQIPHLPYVTGKLGEGQFGTVYRVQDSYGNAYAVKKLKLAWPISIPFARREIEILSQLRHENIVEFYSCHVTYQGVDIVMELMAGSVKRFMEENGGSLNETGASSILRQVLEGVKYLHFRGIIHRDIRCDNILLDNNGKAKLADMGIAKFHQNVRGEVNYSDGAGYEIGPVYWMSPEVLNGYRPGTRSDVWMVGSTAWEMVKGYPPFYDDDLDSLRLLSHQNYQELVEEDEVISHGLKVFLKEIFIPHSFRPSAQTVADRHSYRSLSNCIYYNA